MKWIPWQIFNSRIYKSKVDTLYIGYIIHLRDNDMRKLNPNEILFGVKQRNFNPANICDSTVVHRIGKEVSSVYMEIRHDMLTMDN